MSGVSLEPHAGDILAIRGKGWLSRKILAATGNTVSHVGIVTAVEPYPLVTEALTHVVTRPLWVSTGGVERAWLLRDKTLTDIQTRRIIWEALTFEAHGYNYADIGLQWLDAQFKTRWFTDHLTLGLKRNPICSAVVALAYQSVGLTFGREKWQSITPGDIFAFAQANADKYDVLSLAGEVKGDG